jgi:predicted dehydrogenase
MGGGALGAIGSHIVDSLHWLLGAQVSRVFGQLSTHIAARPAGENGEQEMRRVTADDAANLILNFTGGDLLAVATGASANASMSFVEAGTPLHRLEIFGERGALRVEGDGELWHAEVGAGAWRGVEIGSGHQRIAHGMQDNGWSRGFTRFAQEIVRALLEGRSAVEEAATFEDGHRTQLVLDAARRSHASGSWATPDEDSVFN